MQKTHDSLVISLLFLCLLYGHIIFAMEQLITFNKFSDLRPELQLKVFAHSHNKTSFQLVNKEWFEKASIKNDLLFMPHFRDALYSCEKDEKRLIGVLLHAAHEHNYKGVENILKNSGILNRVIDKQPHLLMEAPDGGSIILDLWDIEFHHKDDKLHALLVKYEVDPVPSVAGHRIPDKKGFITSGCGHAQVKSRFSECNLSLPAHCISGNTAEISRVMNYDNKSMVEQCLKLAIDFDYGKCLNVLFTSFYGSKFKNKHDFLKRACIQRSLNALQVLLKEQSSVINQNFSFYLVDSSRQKLGFLDSTLTRSGTLLDFAIENAQEDSWYNTVIDLLKEHDAKTESELISMTLESMKKNDQ